MRGVRAFDGRVIFDHLPKTAGQAVNAWLAGVLGSGCVSPNLIGGHRELIKRYGGEYSVISGHLAFNGDGLDPRYHYMTCVREPMDRALSWISYVLEHAEPHLLGDLWIEADAFFRSEGGELGSVFAQSICNPYVEHFIAAIPKEKRGEKGDLLTALDVIEQYDVWGVYEEMPRFLGLVARLIKIPAPKEIAKVNVTRSRPSVAQVTAKLRRRLEELNALDLQFYSMLQERWRACEGQRGDESNVVSEICWKHYHCPEPRSFQSSDFELLNIEFPGGGTFARGELFKLSVEFSLASAVPELEIGIHIFDEDGRWAFGTNTTMLERKLIDVEPGMHQVDYWVLADLPQGLYRLGLGVAEKDREKSVELAWFDRLFEFRIENQRRCSVGYSDLPVEFAFRNITFVPIHPINDGRGGIDLCGELTVGLVGETFNCPIELTNLSGQAWGGSISAPLNLSYRWFDAKGECVVADGLRSPLSRRILLPKQSTQADISIKVPDLPGHYRLVVMPVQENRFWFDDRGFTPLELDVDVRSDAVPLALSGADVHFSSMIGVRRAGAMVSTGRAGYLLYGPYLPLCAGRYCVQVSGLASDVTAAAFVEVAYDEGRQIVAKSNVASTMGGGIATLEFVLNEAVRDIEIRVMVGVQDVIRIDGVEILAIDASVDWERGEG